VINSNLSPISHRFPDKPYGHL